MQVRGFCFDGQSSQRHAAALSLDAQGRVCLHFAGRTLHYEAAQMQVASRLGSTPQQVMFSDGVVFASTEYAALKQLTGVLSRRQPRGHGSSWLHRLESRWHWVLAAVLVLLLSLYLGLTKGAPLAARTIVHFIPASVELQIGKQSMQLLDRSLLQASQLPAARQQQLQEHFAPLLAAWPDYPLQVQFRHAPGIGANAFALPGGQMVFTDEIVRLAGDDDELSAVLAHEIGHVERRHGLRRVVQNGLLYWGLFAITGDISAASETIAAAPALLMNMAYSREMENEADDFALHGLRQQGIEPVHFANIMRRLEGASRPDNSGGNRLLKMLSSHPDTEERIRKFEP